MSINYTIQRLRGVVLVFCFFFATYNYFQRSALYCSQSEGFSRRVRRGRIGGTTYIRLFDYLTSGIVVGNEALRMPILVPSWKRSELHGVL